MFRWIGALAGVALVGAAEPAEAVVFNVFDSGSTALLGSFDAPGGGGQVSSPIFEVAGITFDVIDPADVPEYRPSLNDLTGPGGTIFANFYNSAAEGGCAPGACVLFFESENGGTYVYGGINEDTFENIAGGDYAIAPIPLPAGGALLLAGLFGAAMLGRRRGRRAAV